MTGRRSQVAAILRHSFLVATAAACLVGRSEADTYIIPALHITQIYDDNIFFEGSDEFSDRITRVSPGLQLGYVSRQLSLSGEYTFDAERHDDNDSLDSNRVRQFADVKLAYHVDSRLSVFANARHTKSNTPEDISIRSAGTRQGLLIGRAKAEQRSFQPRASYRFGRTVTGTLSYTENREKLYGVGESDTEQFEADVDRKLSANTEVSAGYIVSRYAFDTAPGGIAGDGDSQKTRTPWIGLGHHFGPRSSVILKGGPRISDHSSGAYLLGSLGLTYATAAARLEYERSETTVLGDLAVSEYDSYSVIVEKKFGSRYEINFAPSFTKISQGETSLDVYRVFLEGKYKLGQSVFFSAVIDSSLQKDDSAAAPADELRRNVVQLGVTFVYPRSKAVEGESAYGD